jgi:hypothetical protein
MEQLMVPEPRGIYRTLGGEGLPNYAWVVYGTAAAFDVPEEYYRVRRYMPEFEHLPWKEEYDAIHGVQNSDA